MALQVDIYRVEHGAGFSMPCVRLANRRAAGAPVLAWVCQRHLEILLYNRVDGGSSGAIWKALSQSGLGTTSLCCAKQAVTDRLVLPAEFDQIMRVFKEALPPDVCDPSSLGRIRSCTLLPLATAAVVCRQHGHSGASMAWLRAFSQPVPEAWELREQAERDHANLQVDFVLQDKLEALEQEQHFEVEELSFREELLTMPVFSAVQDDEERMKTYILSPVPSILKKELDEYIVYRTSTFAARRAGGAVQSISAEGDKTALLRFYGYLTRTNRVPEDVLLYLPFMIRADLGDLVQEYASWLQNTQRCKFSTIANYLNGLVSITSYCYGNLAPTDEVLQMEPNPLAQLVNLRAQAEKASKTQQMFDRRVGGWLTWEDVQKARVKSFEKLDEEQFSAFEEKRFALRDCAALSLLSLIPPDRVGCIRKLRLGHTLKRKPGGGWMMDLSKQRDGHKTSKFYGPFASTLPEALTPILDEYTGVLELNAPVDGPYLFHPPQSQPDRPLEPSAWSGWVRRLFKRHHGEEIAPKTLRSVFVTWLRNSTNAPEVLKSAAHAMKHAEARQQSGEYDTEKDDRLIKAAFDFNNSFCANFTAEMPARNGGGSSSAAAAASPSRASLARPGKDSGMTAARAMAGGGFMVAGAVLPPNPAPAPPLVPPSPPTRRCVFANCTSDTPAEGLRECPCGNGPHHHFCSIAAGCEADESLCAACLGVPVFVLAPAAEEAAAAEEAEEEEAQAPADALVDDEWQPLGGGPWVAKLMRPSRQPVCTATYRNFYVPIAFDPTTTPLVPGGQIKFPIVAGAPPEGIICQLPNSWTARQRSLVFRLKLSKSGATANEVTINSVLYRQPAFTDDDDEEEEEDSAAPPLGMEQPVVPLAAAPPEMVAAAAEAAESPAIGAHAADDALLAHEPPLDDEPLPPAVPIAGAPPEGNGDADAIQAAIRANHIEANIGLPDTAPNAVPTLASLCREVVCRSNVPLPGEGEAAVEAPSAGSVPEEHADAMGAVAAAAPAAAPAATETDDEADEQDGDDAAAPSAPVPHAPAPFDAQWAASLLARNASEDAAGDAPLLPIAPAIEPAAAQQPLNEPPSRSRRDRKRKQHFGDAGELDGAASSFRSAPPARKASVDASVDMGVPAYALPGETVLAMGLHAGVRKRFKATVVKLRKQFPRIVVKYIATESGGTHPLELPDPITAYLTMSDVEPGTLVAP